ncbi:MAG: hypothetical protein IKG96_09925 [Bacteroidaceae bacterium]|nr:hypothetical protein [Bacteroidaceae bacterium]
MQTTTLDFPRNARRVYTAVKHVFQTRTRFSNVECDDVHFMMEARRGWFVSPFTESIKVKVVATGTEQSRVTIQSSSRSVLNLLNFGANKHNVTELSDFIQNEVWKLVSDAEIKLRR